jgi:hypothetical protein
MEMMMVSQQANKKPSVFLFYRDIGGDGEARLLILSL